MKIEKSKSKRATIYLEAHWREISLTQIANALYRSLPPSITETTYLDAPARARQRMNDFRDSLVSGLAEIPPLDEETERKIRVALKNDSERSLQLLIKMSRELDQGAPSNTTQRYVERLTHKDSSPDAPLTRGDMLKYAQVQCRRRIQVMLDRDIASNQLRVTSVDGKRVVMLDDLVAWAVPKKVSVEQDALPGCEPLIHASYQRWGGQLPPGSRTSTTVAADASDGVEPARPETKEQRQDRRLADSEAAGLVMPKSCSGRLPDGIGRVAEAEGVTRQAYSADVKAALKRRESAKREVVVVRRA